MLQRQQFSTHLLPGDVVDSVDTERWDSEDSVRTRNKAGLQRHMTSLEIATFP